MTPGSDRPGGDHRPGGGSKRRRVAACLVLWAVLGTIPAVDAAVRPYSRSYRGTEELAPRCEGLVLERVEATLDLSSPASLPADSRPGLRVSERYSFRAPVERDTAFEFFTTVPVVPDVLVNGREVRPEPSVILTDDAIDPPYSTTTRYLTRFPARLQAGNNTVTVAYSHPAGEFESGRGGGRGRSRYSRMFIHALLPLRDWGFSPGFALVVSVRIDDMAKSRGIGDSSRPPLEIFAVAEPGNDRKAGPMPIKIERADPESVLKADLSFSTDFPDSLSVTVP